MKKTIIEIGRGVKCIYPPKVLRQKIEKDLCFENPAYKKAIEQGRSPGNMSPYIILFDQDKDTFWLPRGYVFFLVKFIKQINHPYILVDETVTFDPLDFKFHGKLRDYQKTAESKILNYPVGVLEASTGSGKTTMALSVITKRQQPTLILVHTKELLYQWKDRITEFLKEDCGIIGDGKFQIKPITVGTIQTVHKKLPQITDHFGQLIIDECHRYGSHTTAYAIQDFPAKYFLGLTATPFRSDGLTKIIFAGIGPKIHKVNKTGLFESGAVLQPKIKKVETNFRYTFTNDYSAMVSTLTKDENRNLLICSKIAENLKLFNETILVISDRKNHAKIIRETLQNSYKINSSLLLGSTNKKTREQSVEDIRAGKSKVMIATTSLIMEGFDLSDLTSLFITTPIKFSGRLIQACGRILRPRKGKKPLIYDFRDDWVPVLKYSGYARDRVYRSEWK